MSKNILNSKTFWFGVAQVVLGAFGSLQTVRPDWSWVPILTGCITMILRFYTTTAVHIGDGQ